MSGDIVRNQLLLVFTRAVLAILSFLLVLVDNLSYVWNFAVHCLLSFLPYSKPPFFVHEPSADFHPVVVVTGTSSGIGRDVALALAHAGYTVFAGVRKFADGAQLESDFAAMLTPQKLAEHDLDSAAGNVPLLAWLLGPIRMVFGLEPSYRELLQRTGRIIPTHIDVTSHESIAAAVTAITAYIDTNKVPLAGLINNAGISAASPMELADLDFMRETFDVNFFGPIYLAQQLMPLIRRDKGRIVNVTSIMTWLLGPGFGVYCASKAALGQATASMRSELSKFGCSVSEVQPGVTRSRIWDSVMSQLEQHQIMVHAGAAAATPKLGPQGVYKKNHGHHHHHHHHGHHQLAQGHPHSASATHFHVGSGDLGAGVGAGVGVGAISPIGSDSDNELDALYGRRGDLHHRKLRRPRRRSEGETSMAKDIQALSQATPQPSTIPPTVSASASPALQAQQQQPSSPGSALGISSVQAPAVSATASSGTNISAVKSFSSFTDATSHEQKNPPDVYESMIKALAQSHSSFVPLAFPTKHVVDAIMHALASGYPKATYRVGVDARLLSVVWWFIGEPVFEWAARTTQSIGI
ncbi:NAD(P)-binding protein [Ramicandelaber brevisporus]|nr:NAD(P)-binding protein [Ramicandelaber brevisporus]